MMTPLPTSNEDWKKKYNDLLLFNCENDIMTLNYRLNLLQEVGKNDFHSLTNNRTKNGGIVKLSNENNNQGNNKLYELYP